MKRTTLIAVTILCMALVSCASTGTDPVDRNASNHQPGNPQATEPEEMHGHSMNATGVSTAETSVKGGSATVVTGKTTETTIVTTPGVAHVDATLVPNPTSSTTVSGTSGTGTTTMTDNTATMSGNATVSGNTSASTSSSTWNTNSTTSTTSTTSSTSGNMTSSSSTDDDDDDTATETRRRMRKD